jgi:uncharacterized membrane protein (DUF4010 family)
VEAYRLGTAGILGFAVGLEREWSGRTEGRAPRFAGIRTFLLIGLLGGCAGLLARAGYEAVAVAVVLAVAAVSTAAYYAAAHHGEDLDGTTEVSAIAVVVLGVIAGALSWQIAAGAGSVVVLALNEKRRLHGAIAHVHQEELSAALRFAVLALVILPLLPAGPYLGWVELKPRTLWMIVLLLCAINFIAFLARKISGAGKGFILTGMLGGVISSTAVTLGFARYSKDHERSAIPLAIGVIGACTVLVPRVLLISTALNSDVAVRLLGLLLPAGLIGAATIAIAWKYAGDSGEAGDAIPKHILYDERNPLRFWVAIKLALVFQLAMIAVAFVLHFTSIREFYSTAIVLGLTDVDALTVSMSNPSASIPAETAARAIAVGILSNSVVKFGMSGSLGSKRFRATAMGVLFLMIVAAATALWLRA